eukprot:TRINITY_DN5951_c0_g1_i1.p1 TRINITY_DN5951_c0_g1~~TRINITY_DN5951_c0_g1_i1.p1  ORF type:complete len:340 (+),score=66.52 TRINITY_DN5951_c0_g1_i1:123-1142(+)
MSSNVSSSSSSSSSTSAKDEAKIINPFESTKVKEFSAHKKQVNSIAWNSIGTKLASSSDDHNIHIWNVRESGLYSDFELKGHSDTVYQVAWNPANPELLVSAAADKCIRVWDARSKNASQMNTKMSNAGVKWSPDGTVWSVSSRDNDLLFIDSRKFSILRSEHLHAEINEMLWTKSMDYFFLTVAFNLRIYSYPAFEFQATLEGHNALCLALDMDRDERYVALGSSDAVVTIWDLKELACVRTYSQLESAICCVGFSHDGQYLAACDTHDARIDILEMKKGESVHSIKAKAGVNALAWHPKAHLLAYAGEEQISSSRTSGSGSIERPYSVCILGFSDKS